MLQFINAANAATTSVTIPSHNNGDWLGVFAYNNTSTAAPTTPTAGGTVPTWTLVDGPTGANLNSLKMAWALGTGTTTTGAWTGATSILVVILRGQAAVPIGGHVQGGNAAATGSIASGTITMGDVSGMSILLYFWGHRTVTAWGSAGSGFTSRSSLATALTLNTKDDTTSDGAQTQAFTASASGGYRYQVVEVLALPLPPGRARMVGQAVNRAASYCKGNSGIWVPEHYKRKILVPTPSPVI